MLKKIRDFIYDINDIFVAIIIIAVAAGVIYWRSTNIMAYPDYLAQKNSTPSSNIDFSDIDLEPVPVDPDPNPNPQEQGSFVDPENPDSGNTVDPSDVPVPGQENTAENTNNTENTENTENTNSADGSESGDNTNSEDGEKDNTAENTNSGDNSSGTEEPEIITVMISQGTSWYDVADNLSAMGLIENTDKARMEFVMTAATMDLNTQLLPGSYQVTMGMSAAEIIKILCRVD